MNLSKIKLGHPAEGADDVTAEVELLPLPSSLDAWFVQKMEAYARACVEANTEALQAEIEALREPWDFDKHGGAPEEGCEHVEYALHDLPHNTGLSRASKRCRIG